MKNSIRVLIAALTLASAVLAVPAIASAETLCVNAGASCPVGSPDFGSLQDAMNAAGNQDGNDEILLGDKGTPYFGPFSYMVDPSFRINHVTIKGVGGRPSLTGPVGDTVLTLPDGSLEHLTILSDFGEGRAATLRGSDLRDVKVVGPDSVAPDLRGLDATAATLEDVEITGGFEPALTTHGGVIGGGVVARRLHIHGGASGGITVTDGGKFELDDSRVSAKTFAIDATSVASIRRSVLETSAPGSVGLVQSAPSSGAFNLDHVTVAHTGAPDGSDSAFELRPGTPLDTKLHSVAIAGYTRGFRRFDVNGSPENLVISDSVWNPANDELVGHGFGVLVESRNVHAEPGVVNLGAGDVHLRAGSAAIDRDQVSDLSQFTDLEGVPALDGDGDGIVRPDAGAFEFQPPAPPPAGGGSGDAAGGGDGTGEAGNGTPAPDVIAPALSKLRLVAGAKPVARAARVSVTRARKLRLALTSSETAKVKIVPRRVIRGRVARPRGAIVRAVPAGRASLAIGRALRRLGALRPGEVRLVVTATDAAGNRSAKRVVTLRLKA